jgi:hypothetical protein
MVEGKYSGNLPNIDIPEADVSEKIKDTNPEGAKLYNQAIVEQKLGDPGFFSYISKKAEVKGREMKDYVADPGNDADILKDAEQYDTVVKPTLEKLKKFLANEFVSKLKIIQGDSLNQANAAIESHLGEKAATEADFAEKYSKMIDDFDKLESDAKKIDQELKTKYKLNSDELTQEGLAETAAAWQLQAEKGADVKTANETSFNDANTKIAGQKGNNWGRFKNTIRSFGRNKMSDAEMAEKEKYDATQKQLDTKIDDLQKASADIATKATEKAALTDSIDTTRKDIIDNLKDLDKLRDMLMKIAKDAIIKGPSAKKDKVFNTDDAASTLDEMGDVWSGTDAKFDAQMQSMAKEVYKREVTQSADLGKDARAINSTKMGQFNDFLARNISNPAAKQMMESVIDDAIKAIPVAEKNSPKAAQLALMLRRSQAAKVV